MYLMKWKEKPYIQPFHSACGAVKKRFSDNRIKKKTKNLQKPTYDTYDDFHATTVRRLRWWRKMLFFFTCLSDEDERRPMCMEKKVKRYLKKKKKLLDLEV